MRKVLAEIIAAPIPNKLARNQWRGRLRYGIKNCRRLREEMRTSPPSPTFFLTICAIAKDEGPYLKEWIEWHKRQGVEKIFLYDNESRDNTTDVLAPYIAEGLVVYTYWQGHRRQLAAYDDCLAKHRRETQWIAFLDIDEFLVPCSSLSLTAFLNMHNEAAAVEINWLIYGSNGHKKKSSEPVMARFTAHALSSYRLNRYVKSIVNTRRVATMIGCHEAARIEGTTIDSHGNSITKHFRQRPPQHDRFRINHYAVRSQEEYEEKKARGRASGRHRKIGAAYFQRYDRNDISEP